MKLTINPKNTDHTYAYNPEEIVIYPRECIVIKEKDKPAILLKEECIERIEIKEG